MKRLVSLVPVACVALANCNLLFAFAPDQICESQVRALCHYAYACCSQTERTAFVAGFDGFRSEGECINEKLEEGEGNCLNSFQVQDAQQQQRFAYDTALAEKCTKPVLDLLNSCNADALDAQVVDELTPDECDDVDGLAFGTGLVKDEGACFAAFECETPESLCDVNDEEARELDEETQVLVTAAGTCLPPAALDEDCSESLTDEEGSDGRCEVGTFCDAEEDFTCQALRVVGDECLVDAECETEFCNALEDPPECSELLADGEECLESNDCLSELCDLNDDDELVCTAQPDIVVEACNGFAANDAVF